MNCWDIFDWNKSWLTITSTTLSDVVGLIKLKDNETGKVMWVDTSDKTFQKKMEVNHLKFEAQIKDVFTKSGVDFTTINTHEGYNKPLMTLFKKR